MDATPRPALRATFSRKGGRRGHDAVVGRTKRTFRYADGGVLGLAKDKKAVLVLASGGVFTEGPWRRWDFVEPYLRQILGFIGVVDVQTVRIEEMNMPLLAANAAPKADQAVEALVL